MSNQVDEYELTKGQKLAGNIISGVYTLGCGVFLLLVGLGLIAPLTIENTTLVAILITIGLVFFTTSLIQVNTVSLWLSFCFFTPSAVTILVNAGVGSYASLYPIYIAIPAIASLFTMIMSKARIDHLKTIFFFGVIAGIFALESSGLVGWEVVIPALIVFIGLLITVIAIKSKREDADNE